MPPAVHGAIIDCFRRTAGVRGLSENGRYRHNGAADEELPHDVFAAHPGCGCLAEPVGAGSCVVRLRGDEVIDVCLPEAVDPVLAASVVYAFVRAGDPLPAELTV